MFNAGRRRRAPTQHLVEKHELWVVALSESMSREGYFALILEEPVSKRRLPVLIGQSEAQAIAIYLEHLQPARPLTHELLHTALETLGASLTEVVLTRCEDEVFFAELVLRSATGQRLTLDARPSDAIALAVRASCPLYATAAVLAAAYAPEQPSPESSSAYLQYSLEELEALLHQVIRQEDYERAARVRDALERRRAG